MRTSLSIALAGTLSLSLASALVEARSDAQRVDLGKRHADALVGGQRSEKMIKRRLVKRGEVPLPGSALLLTVPNVTLPSANDTLLNSSVVSETINSTAAAVLPTSYNGTALWFMESGSKSACYTISTDDDLVVGLPTQWWNDTGVVSPLCGQYLFLTNPSNGQNVTALISDASGKEYVTLTKAAFRALAPLQEGMISVTYSFLNATTNSTTTPAVKGASAVSASPLAAVAVGSASVQSAAPESTTAEAPKTTVAATTTAAPTTTTPSTTTTFFDSASYSSSKAAAESAAAAAAASSSSKAAASAKAEAQAEAQAAASSSAAAAAAASAASSRNAAAAASSKAAAQAAAASSSSAAAAAAASASAKAKAQAQADQQAQLQAQQQQQQQQNSGGGGGKTYTGGWATFFYQNGVAGACGAVNPDSAKVIAIDSAMYDGGANCGRKIKLTRTDNGASVVATVADECPTCASGTSLDLSVGAFDLIATVAEGMVPISWQFLD